MGFLRQESRSELPFPPPGDLPKPRGRTWVSWTTGDSLLTEPPGKLFSCKRSLDSNSGKMVLWDTGPPLLGQLAFRIKSLSLFPTTCLSWDGQCKLGLSTIQDNRWKVLGDLGRTGSNRHSHVSSWEVSSSRKGLSYRSQSMNDLQGTDPHILNKNCKGLHPSSLDPPQRPPTSWCPLPSSSCIKVVHQKEPSKLQSSANHNPQKVLKLKIKADSEIRPNPTDVRERLEHVVQRELSACRPGPAFRQWVAIKQDTGASRKSKIRFYYQ